MRNSSVFRFDMEKKPSVCRTPATESEYRINDAAADGSTSTETFASQHGDA